MSETPAAPVGSSSPQAPPQRRHVTFLFADLVGSSALSEQLEAEEFHGLIGQWLQAMTEEVERFGGTLNQFSGDGILVLFGAPLAQEDAPVQACRAALALQYRVAGLETAVRLSMRIGVDSGEIVAGLVGTDRRNEYAALGQRTNRAKRVQEQADPGSILISQDTYDLVREYFRLVPAGEFCAKGLADPIAGYRLIDEKGRGGIPRLAATMARWHSPFVGRRSELGRLERALNDAAQRRAQTVTVHGDAGVGKSRLLYEVAQRARERGFAVHEGRSDALRTHVPYAPYADILRSFCSIAVDDIPATVAGKLRASFPDDVAYLHDVVTQPTALPTAPASQSVGDSNARMLATFSAVERAIRSIAQRQPLLLIFDDFHWSDPLSRQLTLRIVDACDGEALLLCTAVRSGVLDHDIGSAAKLHLQPLVLADIEELGAGLDGLTDDDIARLSRWLERQTGGLPLFIEELLIALQSNGSLRCDSSRWRLAADFEREHLPGSVQDLIASRIDRLPPHELEILQLASVIGDELTLAEIETVARASEGLVSGLSSLEQQGLLTGEPLRVRFRFRSALARRVVYRTVPRQRRQALHLRLAEAAAGTGVRRIDDTVLAEHFHQGGDSARAIALLRRAASRAEWAFGNADAVALLTRVISIGSSILSDVERADVLIQRGRLRTAFLGDKAGLDDVDQAIALAASRDSALHSRALLNKGVALFRQFRFTDSLEWLAQAEQAAAGANAAELRIEALLQRSFVLSEIRISGTSATAMSEDAARRCCEQALALSRENNKPALEIQSLHSLGTAYLQELDYDRAQQTFEHCIQQAHGVEDRVTEALALQSLARVQQFRGDCANATATILRLQGLLRDLGDHRRLAFSTFNLAAAYLGSGRPEQARRAAEEALPQATRLGLGYLEKLVLRFIIGLYSGPEFVQQRVDSCEQLRRLLIEESERSELSDLLIELANAYVESGDGERSAAILSEAAKLDIDLANFTRAQWSLQRLCSLKK
ncbi:MAG: AAA family ATPase [Deltaproteobacteria bacterium]|nr:AAA family ATPase [Deltaproteobacteria bacterium]